MTSSNFLAILLISPLVWLPQAYGQGDEGSNADFQQLKAQADSLNRQLTTTTPLSPDQRDNLIRQIQVVYGKMDAIQLGNFNRGGTAANSYNQSVDRLAGTRDKLAAQTDYFNNVTSLRKRDDLYQWLAAGRDRWNSQNGATGRIGIVNPYDGSSYYRYYDDKGNLIQNLVKGDYKLLQQARDDWNQSFKRAKDVYDRLQGDYDQITRQYGEAMAVRGRIADLMSEPRATAPSPTSGGDGVTTKDGVRYKDLMAGRFHLQKI
jgi:hypothetical protein